jgi:LysR family transcriptional regulator, glycine cleavage system transcriptional activator
MTTPAAPLRALRTFELVMRLGGVGRAAERLGVTHGAVSRQISQLQSYLGQTLFEGPRNARRPTAEAERLWREVAPTFAELEASMERRRGGGWRLRVSCLSTLAARWLIPRLPDFAAIAPELTIELTESYAALDRTLGGADLAIRMWLPDAPVPEGLDVLGFMDNAIGLVVAPARATALPEARLVSRSHPTSWTSWSLLSGQLVPTGGVIEFDHQQTMIEAAVAGLGAAVAQRPLVAADLHAGRLVAPYGFVADGAVFAVFSRTQDRTTAARRFLDWLGAQGAARTH